MTQAEIEKMKAIKAKLPAVGRAVLARLAGVSESQSKDFLKGTAKAKTAKVTAIVAVHVKGKTLADFRQVYDKATIVPAKVKAAIKLLGVSGWEYESQFAKIAGVTLSDIGMFRDQFAGHIVSLRDNRRAWAGSEKTANIMREMI